MKSFKEFLAESSLSRVWQHVQNDDDAFGVMSAMRGKLSWDENIKRHKELIGLVRGAGFGFIQVKGRYTEEETGVPLDELALFIPTKIENADKLKACLFRWGAHFQQDTVIYKDDDEFVLYTPSGHDVLRFASKSGAKNLTLAGEMLQSMFSSLSKGSHRNVRYLFSVQEGVQLSGVYANLAESVGKMDRDYFTIFSKEVSA